MVVGSGPKNITGANGRDYNYAAAAQTWKLFVVDLGDGSLDKTFTLDSNITTLGDPISVDVDLNFTSDVVYIGSGKTVSSTSSSGKVYRIKTNGKIAGSDSTVAACPADTTTTADWCWSLLMDTGKPLLVSPSISKDTLDNLWVFFGTGRLRSTNDLSNSEQQRFYGIKDPCGKPGSTCSATYTESNLFDASGVTVSTTIGGTQVSEGTGTAGCEGSTSSTSTTCSFNTLIDTARTKQGWFVNLTDVGTLPSERSLSRSVVLGGLVLFTAYKPTGEMCSIFGDSTIYALYYETGTAYIKPTLPAEGGARVPTGWIAGGI
jgi:type IV pilus assembly protein PilY1